MKKIVGIMAAAAMAASMFAVDFSAGVRMEGSLFNYDGKNVSALKEQHNNQFYHAPIAFAVSGDQAGAQLKLTDLDSSTVKSDAWSIWFKPVDAVKVTVGRWSANLNQEHIGWCNTDSGIESDGYALTFASGAFSADLFLASGNANAWFTKNDGKSAAMKELYAKVNYGADFGTLNAFVNGNRDMKDYRFGAGVNVAGLPVGLWFNVIGQYASDKFERVRAEMDVSGSIDSVGYEVFVTGGANLEKSNAGAFTGVESWHVGGTEAKGAFCGFYAKLSMPIGALGGYVELKDSNVLADDFNMTIKPGFTVNVGACAINCAVDFTAAKTVKVDVPVEFKVNF